MNKLVDLQKAQSVLERLEHEIHNYPSEICLSTVKELKELFSCFQAHPKAKKQTLRKLLEEFPYFKCQKVKIEDADDRCSNQDCENYRSCNWFWRVFGKELLASSGVEPEKGEKE